MAAGRPLVAWCVASASALALASAPDETRWREGLAARDPVQRARIVSEIAFADPGHAAADRLLVGALEDADPSVRSLAASMLARRRAIPAIGALASLLDDERASVRETASEALVALAPGPGASAALAEARAKGAPEVRARLVPALLAAEEAPAHLALGESLSDEDAGVRAAADRALRLAPADRAGRVLAACFDSPRDAAQVACAQLAREQKATRALPRLAAIAIDDFEHRDVRDASRAAVLAMKDDLDTPGLAARAREASDRQVRADSLLLLAVLGGDRAYAALTHALGDGDEVVRQSAAGGLAQLGDARAIGPLSKALDRPENARIRRTLQRAIDRLLQRPRR